MDIKTESFYNRDGQKVAEIQTLNGVKHGTVKSFGPESGRLWLEIEYVNGIRSGYSTWYDYTKEEERFFDTREFYVNDICEGVAEYWLGWHKRYEIQTYKRDRDNGVYITFKY